jgi:hypothetical protein
LRRYPDLKVGLVWAGNRQLKSDHLRSMKLDRYAPLMHIMGVQFFSLQKGDSAQELGSLDWPIVDWMHDCGTLADTAALIANLDLVISVDTAVAHLAGALGRPVWLLNRFESEWRWMMAREDSPWYPTMRIFRQPGLHDWDSAITRVRGELDALARNHQPPLSTPGPGEPEASADSRADAPNRRRGNGFLSQLFRRSR